MVVDPRAPTRKELERFLPDQRSVRAFEKLFELVPGSLVLESSVTIVGGSYTTEGNQTLICLAPADITLQSVNVKDAARVTIKRFNGEVKVFASTLIDGRTPPTIINRDLTSLDFYFSEPELAWFIT